MTSNRPYIIRGLNEWIIDNGMTPQLMVDANYPGTQVPDKYVKDGKIVLNITANAVKDLHLGNEFISFNARFSGLPASIRVPINAVMAIYARENGNGMIFTEETGPDTTTGLPVNTTPSKKPGLKVIK